MKNYIVQKADQALDALDGSEPLSECLELALLHLRSIDDEFFLNDAPDEVVTALRQALESDPQIDPEACRVAVDNFAKIANGQFGKDEAAIELDLIKRQVNQC